MPHLPGKDRWGLVRPSAFGAVAAPQPVAEQPRVFVVSGPSGAGKGTLIEAVLPRFPRLCVAVSATTRPRRQGEREGVDYHFLEPSEFAQRAARGDFLEHVEYAGHHYGTLREEVETKLAAGCSVVVEIELHGARAIRRMLPQAVSIFIVPPSLDELARRLEERARDSSAEIAARLTTGRLELAAMGEFDHRILNDDVHRAADELARLVGQALAEPARG